MKPLFTRNKLSLFIGAALALSAGAALAQTASSTTNPTPAKKVERLKTIMVTGSLIPQIDVETAAPVQVITAQQIQRSGFTSVSAVVRSISADNSGTLPTSFANGFASGASGVALRGLNVGSTLVLIDGQRAASYALDDDGQRSFVDLNSIPLNAVERIEVLKDSASSIYGSDAIGGVVNIILYRTYRGAEVSAEMGASQKGGGSMSRATLIAGTGSLARDGHNAYIDIEYQKTNPIYASERGFPYNTSNLSSIGGFNNNAGAAPLSGSIYGAVAPATLTDPTGQYPLLSGNPTGLFQPLRPCGPGTVAGSNSSGSYCTQNFVGQYGQLAPQLTRYAIDGRMTVRISDNAQAYLNASYVQVNSQSQTPPSQIQAGTPINTTNITLPAVLSNNQLNPNDPFAAQGEDALINYAFGDLPGFGSYNDTNHNLRVVADLNGYYGPWRYDAAAVINHTWLTVNNYGYINFDQLYADILDGAYSFINPSSNSAAVRAALAPTISNTATTDLESVSLTASRHLWRMAGGRSGLGLGVSFRHDSQYEPALNPGNIYLGLGNTQIIGSEKVGAVYGQFQMPLLDTLTANISGRYDDYSNFGTNFSPAAGIKWQPIKQVAFRATYSKGFKAPSFAESGSSQSIGFVTYTPPASFAAQHGGDGYSTTPYNLGLQSSASPNLKPEKSTSYTLGTIVQPLPDLSATLDYYHIKKTNVITVADSSTALNAYYAGQPIPAGYSLTLNSADPNYPGALPTVLVVSSPYINANSLVTDGVDLDVRGNFHFADNLEWISQFTSTDIMSWKENFGQGYVQFVGTHGPYELSSGAGTPKWRASWSNTLTNGKWSATASIYYVSHLYMSVPDIQPGCYSQGANGDFPASCTVPSFTYVDLNGSYHITPKIDIYGGIENLFDRGAGLDPIDYANGYNGVGANYNPTYQQQGMIGRYFQLGVRVRI
ncbi:MAG: TonB-dependent receptor [Proteobacteria bacterium]|nr:TonB-dependent receptor [Pseudomonadota bacterium]